MALQRPLDEFSRTEKVDLVSSAELSAPEELPLLTGDFELVDAAELVAGPGPTRPALFLVKDPPVATSGAAIRPKRETQIITRRIERPRSAFVRKLVAEALDEARAALGEIKVATLKLPLVLALLVGAFLLGGLMTGAARSTSPAAALDVNGPAAMVAEPPPAMDPFPPIVASPPTVEEAVAEEPVVHLRPHKHHASRPRSPAL